MVADKKVIHFGYFVRWRRETVRQWTRKRLALEVGMTERRLAAIEELPEPTLHGANMAKLSAALGMEPDELRTAWKVTPVPVPVKRKGRTFETVTIKLPRDAYDRIAAIADRAGLAVEDFIELACREHPLATARSDDRIKIGQDSPRVAAKSAKPRGVIRRADTEDTDPDTGKPKRK